MSRRRRTLALPSLCSAVAISLWLSVGGMVAQEGPRASASLTILQINDVYTSGPVDGGKRGSLARVATVKKDLIASGKSVLLMLAGDFLSPSVASAVFKGQQMVDALNATGLDVATFGNHEFDFGLDVLRERMRAAKWQWVSSNVLDDATGEPLGGAAPYLVRQFGMLKVGIIGLCLIGEEISPDKRMGVRFLEPADAVAKYLPILKAQGVNTIVALTHLSYAEDRALVERFPEIDVIVGGHEHFPITSVVNRTLITKAGSDARFVARVDVTLDGAVPGTPSVERHFELIPVTDAIEEDRATAAVTADYESRLGKELDLVVGSTTTPLDAVAEHVRSAENNTGNLIADVMRLEVRADLAIVNGGTIRSNQVYPAGPLTRRDLVALLPFASVTCKIEVPGTIVLAALNHGVARLGEGVGRFPQVSGITFRVDPSGPPGDRIRDVRVGGVPLDPRKNYTVAVTDYMLRGGDGYSMFANAKVLVAPEQGNLMSTALEDFVRQRDAIGPVVEDRMRFMAGASSASTRPVLIDTDMGIDDVIGILYLLKAPQIAVKAVTTTHGMTDVKVGAANAARVLALAGHAEIPVGAGRPGPLRGARAFPALLRAQAERLGGAKLPTGVASRPPVDQSAEDLLLAELDRSPEPVTLITMGPLTNVALALRKKPEAKNKIRELVAMGGAIETEGNVHQTVMGLNNTAAEWNIYLDPDAAREVMSSGLSIRLVPLDATKEVPVTAAFVDRVRNARRDDASNLLLALLEAVNSEIAGGSFYFWDALAAVVTAWPDVTGTHEERIEVVTEEGPTFGQTKLVSDRGALVRIAEEVNREAFEEDLLRTILR